MRCFCLCALFLSGVLLVIADIASGLEELEALVLSALPPESKPDLNLQSTPSSGKEVREDRAFFSIESVTAKLYDLVKLIKAKVNALFELLLKTRKAKHEGKRSGYTKSGTKVNPLVDEFGRVFEDVRKPNVGKRPSYTKSGTKVDPPADKFGRNFNGFRKQKFGKRPSRTDAGENAGLLVDANRIIDEFHKHKFGKSRGYVEEDLTRLVDDLYKKEEFKIVRDELVKANKGESLEAKTFRNLQKKFGSVMTARFIHQKLNTETGRKLEKLQFNWWLLSRQNPEDIVKGALKHVDTLDKKIIAMQIVANYKEYLRRIRRRLAHVLPHA